MKKYFIITGASKGLGLAFTEGLIHEDHVLFLIARSEIPDISTKAMLKNCRIHNISFDLSDIENIPHLISNLFDHINDDCEGIYLINNAAIVEPVMPIDKAENGAIEKIIQVNLMAPVLLVSNFIRLSKRFAVQKQILNITSGAAANPHLGMSLYGSTKAALDVFTKSVSLEQTERKNPVHIHAISPGFVDTQMPQKLLEKDESEFGGVEQFRISKNAGKFRKPLEVADKILQLWFSGKLKHGEVSHLSEY